MKTMRFKGLILTIFVCLLSYHIVNSDDDEDSSAADEDDDEIEKEAMETLKKEDDDDDDDDDSRKKPKNIAKRLYKLLNKELLGRKHSKLSATLLKRAKAAAGHEVKSTKGKVSKSPLTKAEEKRMLAHIEALRKEKRPKGLKTESIAEMQKRKAELEKLIEERMKGPRLRHYQTPASRKAEANMKATAKLAREAAASAAAKAAAATTAKLAAQKAAKLAAANFAKEEAAKAAKAAAAKAAKISKAKAAAAKEAHKRAVKAKKKHHSALEKHLHLKSEIPHIKMPPGHHVTSYDQEFDVAENPGGLIKAQKPKLLQHVTIDEYEE